MNTDNEPYLYDVLDIGQGDDLYIREIMDGFYDIYRGYYHITAIDGDIYTTIIKRMNQGIDFDSLLKQQLDRIDWNTFEDVIDKIAIILIGGYCRKRVFFEAIQNIGKTDYVRNDAHDGGATSNDRQSD